jgi:hypothetical protein
MRLVHLQMHHSPMAQLLQDLGLASNGHPANRFAIHAQPERSAHRERQIQQLDPKLVASLKIGTDPARVPLGRGPAPSHLIKPKVRNKSNRPCTTESSPSYADFV